MVAVLNLFSTAGYIVQWFGDTAFNIPNYSNETDEPGYEEIDIIAYAPDGSHIAFIECTNKRISEKISLLDRMEDVSSDIISSENIEFGPGPDWPKSTVPCIATPLSPSKLNPEVVTDFEEKGIEILHSERLVQMYEASENQEELVSVGGEPGFWWQQGI